MANEFITKLQNFMRQQPGVWLAGTSIQIHVKSLAGPITLDVFPEETILDVKYKIQRQEPLFKVWTTRLYMPLEDESFELSDYIRLGQLRWRNGQEVWIINNTEFCMLPESRLLTLELQNPGIYHYVDSLWLEDQFKLVRGNRYILPLRSVEDEPNQVADFQVGRYHVNTLVIKYNDGRSQFWRIRNGSAFTGVFSEVKISHYTVNQSRFVNFSLKLVPPFQLYIQNQEDITDQDQELMNILPTSVCRWAIIRYHNIIPCEDDIQEYIPEENFQGRKHKRSSKRSVRNYIRRSIKKELRKLMK